MNSFCFIKLELRLNTTSVNTQPLGRFQVAIVTQILIVNVIPHDSLSYLFILFHAIIIYAVNKVSLVNKNI